MSSREYLGNRYYFKPNTYDRTRYKKTSWRRDAVRFLKSKQPHYGSWGRNYLYNVQHALPHKVGWTAKAAPVGKARAAQNRWRRAYFKRHGQVV